MEKKLEVGDVMRIPAVIIKLSTENVQGAVDIYGHSSVDPSQCARDRFVASIRLLNLRI